MNSDIKDYLAVFVVISAALSETPEAFVAMLVSLSVMPVTFAAMLIVFVDMS